MRKSLDNLLCRRYPELFADRHGDMRTTAMCWGFACGDGWYTLVDALCAEIRRHADEAGASVPVVQQVKEKYGSLRFYVAGADDWIHDLIWFADYLSGVICEECGASGYAIDADCYRTRCVAHGGKAPPVVKLAEPRAFVLPPIAAPGWRHLAQSLASCIENYPIQRPRAGCRRLRDGRRGRAVAIVVRWRQPRRRVGPAAERVLPAGRSRQRQAAGGA